MHQAMIRSIGVDKAGRFLVTGSEDHPIKGKAAGFFILHKAKGKLGKRLELAGIGLKNGMDCNYKESRISLMHKVTKP